MVELMSGNYNRLLVKDIEICQISQIDTLLVLSEHDKLNWGPSTPSKKPEKSVKHFHGKRVKYFRISFVYIFLIQWYFCLPKAELVRLNTRLIYFYHYNIHILHLGGTSAWNILSNEVTHWLICLQTLRQWS